MSVLGAILLAIIASVVAPSILSVLTGRQQERRSAQEAEQLRQDRQAAWDREDALAARAAANAEKIIEGQKATAEQAAIAAQLLLDQQAAVAAKAEEAANLLLAANERVASTTAVTNEKLDVIHGLVNSNLTGEMEQRLVVLESHLILLREVAGRDEEAAKTETQIGLLRTELAERATKTAALDTKIAEAKT